MDSAKKMQEIADFWSSQLNNEIYLSGKDDVERGSKEYFQIFLDAREKFIYYRPSINEFLNAAPSRKLLEVGSGMGTDSYVFAQQGFDVTGVDLAQGHIDLARKLFEQFGLAGNFLLGNAEQLEFEDGSFDCAYSFGVLHHTPDTAKAISEVHRVLTPGGRAVIMLYNRHSLNNLAHFITRKGFENARGDEDAPVTTRFSKAEVAQMCASFSACRIEREYLFGAGWGKAYDLLPASIYRLLSTLIGWHLVAYVQK